MWQWYGAQLPLTGSRQDGIMWCQTCGFTTLAWVFANTHNRQNETKTNKKSRATFDNNLTLNLCVSFSWSFIIHMPMHDYPGIIFQLPENVIGALLCCWDQTNSYHRGAVPCSAFKVRTALIHCFWLRRTLSTDDCRGLWRNWRTLGVNCILF